jgi:Domain of unknown function (DUF1707)
MADLEMRVSDREREAVAEQLREHAAEGRLDPDELEERLTAAYAARTRGDLAGLTRDLPERPPAPPPRTAVHRSLRPAAVRILIIDLFCIAIWALSDPGGYFWPAWVILATAFGLTTRWAAASAGSTSRPAPGRETRPDRDRPQ